MATRADAETALRDAVAAAVAPAGSIQPGTNPPVSFLLGAPVRVQRGWPTSPQLQADLAAGVINIAVYAKSGMYRRIQPPFLYWNEGPRQVETLTVAVTAGNVTFGGTPTAAQVAAVLIGNGPRKTYYPYRCSNADTPATVAAGLAALIWNAASDGPTLLTRTNEQVSAVVMADGSSSTEVQWQEQGYCVSTWCSDADKRDVVTGLFQPALGLNYRLTLADGSFGLIWQTGERVDDRTSLANAWFANLDYTMRYATTVTVTQPRMIAWIGTAVINRAALVALGSRLQPITIYTDAAGNPLVDAAGNLIGAHP